ncbi:DMT family transporter [Jezberella montanilacus]|uniref:DMT family transporter n=1 Tax=Jezberella montanilacus TaxID=323426 RepID=UPI000D05BBD4|nr:DMT family transporter [Jezberella montanilacus]
MSFADTVRLLSLAAIWGGSFLFMRVAAPVLGPAFLMEGRVFFAASFLLVLALVLKKRHEIFKHWKHFFIMGLFNCALPWYLFGQAALKLTTAQLSIINALAPLFAFVIGLVMRTDKLESKRAIGLLLGILGVAVLFGNLDSTGGAADIASVLMATGASFAYGIATSYTKAVKGLEPFHNALGSLWMASFILLPTLFFVPIRGVVTTTVVLATLAIGIVCSGIAFLIYFKLIKNVGASSALTVSFLIPVFSMLFGVIFLHEIVTLRTIVGMLIILVGTALVTGFSARGLIGAKRPAS